MAKSKKAVAPVAAPEPAVQKTTDKTFDSLPLHAEVVVQVGPRQRIQNNKLITVDEARNVIFTKNGFLQMDRNEEGETTHIATELLGIPEYKTVVDLEAADGVRTDFDILYFADEADEVDEEEA